MKHVAIEPVREAVSSFLADLNEASRRHGIGLTHGPTLFLMETEDYDRAYSFSPDSELVFA